MAETIPRRTQKLGYDPGAVPGESYDLGPIPVQGPDGPPIYVPVQPEDHQRRLLRRLRWLAIILTVVGSAGYWLYKSSVDPIQAHEAFNSGAKFLQAGRYQQAILSFDQVIALQPDYVEAYQLRGRANMALSKPLQAGPDFSKVIALRPQDAEG
ncbi:MAG: tetratricopeptide repeat protein, partial [Acidobacteriota bacterium]